MLKKSSRMMFVAIGAILLFLSITNIVQLAILEVKAIPSLPDDGATYIGVTDVRIEIPRPVDENVDIYSAMSLRIDTIRLNLVEQKSGKWDVRPKDITTTPVIYIGTWINSLSVGAHSFEFTSSAYFKRDETFVGQNTIIKTGTFTINPTPSFLTGDWYIGSTKIISSSQKVTVYTNNILFKFIKTSTLPNDTKVTATVFSSGGIDKTLTYQGAGVWSDTIYFDNGTYNVELKATDGTTIVRMSIIMGIGEEPITTNGTTTETRNLMMRGIFGVVGAVLIGIGLVKRKIV